MSKDPKRTRPVYDLLESIEDGDYVIPHFQRGYEWTPSMVTDLLISIVQDYFSGLLLFWQLPSTAIKEEKWDPLWGAEKSSNPVYAILDGQQRLASLYYAINGPAQKFPERNSFYMFFLDVENYLEGNYEEAIFYSYSRKYVSLDEVKQKKDEWIKDGVFPLRVLSDRKYVDGKEFNEWIRGYTQKYMKVPNDWAEYDRLRDDVREAMLRIKNYEFVTHTLGRERELADICGIFARINQKGMRLSTFDLMNAFLYPKGVSLRKLWETLDNERLKEIDSDMNEYLLRLMSLYVQEYCSSKYVYYLIPEYKIRKRDATGKVVKTSLIKSGKEFSDLWKDACEYADKAIVKLMNVGKSDFGAIKSDFIPNTTIIPVMGALLIEYEKRYKSAIPRAEFYDMLSTWYWSAVISGDYSGSSDSVMSEDYRDIKAWFGKREISAIRRVQKVNKEFIQGLNLEDCKKGSSLYNAILCIIALNKAEDFYTARVLDTGTYKEEKIHDHHIFPKSAKGYPPKLTKKFKSTKDSILNRTILLDETNESIRAKKPSEYLKIMKSELKWTTDKAKVLMEKHLISDEAFTCMKQDDYDKFIGEREKTILEKLLDSLK